MDKGKVLLILAVAALAAGCAASGKALIEQYKDVTPTRFEGAVILLGWIGYNVLLAQQVQFSVWVVSEKFIDLKNTLPEEIFERRTRGVLPTASRGSVTARTLSSISAISAIPPALSVMGP